MTGQSITSHRAREVQHYNPQKGLRKIAAAEAGEQHCRRARDTEGLIKEVVKKMEAQAEYILWRDAATVAAKKAGHGPGRGKKGDGAGAMSFSVALPKGDPGTDTAARWRKSFCKKVNARTVIDRQKIEEAIADARLRCVRVCERQKMSTIRGTEGTGEFLRYTPSEYVEVVRKCMGRIDLDPASDKQAQQTVKAEKYFTEEDDGLKQEWHADKLFLNPPYNKKLMPAFIDKLVQECEAGHVKSAIVLTNNCTDTEWFVKAAAACDAICFTYDRINFLQEDGKPGENPPTQGQAFFYFGEDVAGFAKHFSEIGWFCSFGVTR